MSDPPHTPVAPTTGGAAEVVSEPTATAATPAAPDKRLIITKLVLDNFKSYYGEVVIGPLHKCFSSIVGPNGSGKSNVIDALLFVFGYRAKQMRQSKVSELIHNSKIHKNLDTAKVSVHFTYIKDKGGDDYEPIPGSDLVVTRTAHRNNSSKYYVNGKASTHAEVTDMLKDTGIELGNNRFMILQGEVEGIALKGPKAQGPHDQGLLEYIEDIIGSDRFVDLIQQTSEKVGTLGEERTEKLQRVKVVEKEMTNLEGAKTEAEKFIELQNKLDLAQGTLYQVHAALANREADSVEEEHAALSAQCKELADGLKEQQAKLVEMEQQFGEKQKEHDDVKVAMQKSKAEFAVFERKDVVHREQIAFQRKTAKSLEAKIKKEDRDMASNKADLEKHKANIPKAEAAVKTLVEKHEAEEKILEGIFQETREETAHFQADIEKLQVELEPYAAEVNTCTGTRDELQNELDLLSTRVEEGQKALAEVEASLKTATKQLKDRKALVQDLTVKRDTAKTKLDAKFSELKQVQADLPNTEADLRAARSKAEELKVEKDTQKSRGAVLEGLLKQKTKGSIPGIHGRLGDLGAIDEKYDIAISTACGSLNNIVVDTRDAGQRCVEFLKEQQLGRATFLMLDGVSQLTVSSGPFPEGVPRLYDLVKVADESLKPAFYFALRDTLVAKDLDQATRIAYADKSKPRRVVTLDGQIIEATGAMSGGGKKVAKGGMRATLTYTAEEAEGGSASVDEAEADVKRLTDAHRKLAARQKQLVPEITQLKKQIKLWDTDLRKAEVDIESLKIQIDESNTALPELRANATVSADDQAAIKDLQQRVKVAKTQLSAAEKKAKAIEVKIDSLKEQVLEIGGVRLRSQKFKVEGLQKDINKKEEALTKGQVQVKACEKSIKKGIDRKAKAEGDLAALKVEMETTKAEFRQIEEDALKVMQAFQKTEALLATRKEELEDIRKEYEALKKAIASQRAKDVDLTNKLDDLTRTIKDAKSRANQWKRKLGNIRRRATAKPQPTRSTRQTATESPEATPAAPVEAGSESKDDTVEAAPDLAILKDLEGEELDAAVKNQGALEVDIATVEQQIGEMKPNMGAIQEYAAKESEYTNRVAELDEVTARRDAARQEHDSLRKRRLDEFMAGFSVITMKLKEMYQMITLGGDAELELVDSLDPFSEGIVFSVRPPKKSWKNISNLSGGEKTLASLALVFALHHYKPTPLYVMDEIDAALDFRNVSIVANYIKERTKNAQFIIISLRNNMFELGDRLVGIYKTQDCTKSITIDPHAVVVPDPAVTER